MKDTRIAESLRTIADLIERDVFIVKDYHTSRDVEKAIDMATVEKPSLGSYHYGDFVTVSVTVCKKGKGC